MLIEPQEPRPLHADLDQHPSRLHPERMVGPGQDRMQLSLDGVQTHPFQVAPVFGLGPIRIPDRQQFGVEILVDGPNGHVQLRRDLSDAGPTRRRQKHLLSAKGNPSLLPDMGWSLLGGLLGGRSGLLGSPFPRTRTLGIAPLHDPFSCPATHFSVQPSWRSV